MWSPVSVCCSSHLKFRVFVPLSSAESVTVGVVVEINQNGAGDIDQMHEMSGLKSIE